MKELSDSKFVDYIEKKVRKTIRQYSLFTPKDKIGMAVSGGKDSTVCLYILTKLGYNIQAITIDAAIGNYTKTNVKNLTEVCKKLKIPLHTISFINEFGKSLCYLRDALKAKGKEFKSCMLCGILKRYLLNKYSKELEFNYLATGHNLDDEAQSFMMNVFRNDLKLASRQGPKPGLTNSKNFVQRVKPLYHITEQEIIRYSKIKKFPVNYDICPCSTKAFRREFLTMLNEFEKTHPDVKYNIIKFSENMKDKLTKEKNLKIETCTSCGEPTANKICKACEIFSLLK